LFFGQTGAREHEEVFFVSFRFKSFAHFVSGFHRSRNLSAQTGDRFSFSVAQDQMLIALGDRAPLEHSLAYLSWSNWNLEMFVFAKGGKPENLEENPQSKTKTNNEHQT